MLPHPIWRLHIFWEMGGNSTVEPPTRFYSGMKSWAIRLKCPWVFFSQRFSMSDVRLGSATGIWRQLVLPKPSSLVILEDECPKVVSKVWKIYINQTARTTNTSWFFLAVSKFVQFDLAHLVVLNHIWLCYYYQMFSQLLGFSMCWFVSSHI